MQSPYAKCPSWAELCKIEVEYLRLGTCVCSNTQEYLTYKRIRDQLL